MPPCPPCVGVAGRGGGGFVRQGVGLSGKPSCRGHPGGPVGECTGPGEAGGVGWVLGGCVWLVSCRAGGPGLGG